MSTIINATTTNGVVIQPDNSGSLVLQTNSGTTALTIDTSQRAAFVAGTAALPAITTTGDINTGIFFPAADTIAFAEGGTEAMRLDSSGNVGIGTSSPSFYGSGLTVTNRIMPQATPSTNWGIDFATDTGGNNYITLAASATYDLATGGGLVLINANNIGDSALFLTYNGNTNKISGGSIIVSGTGGANQIGLTWNAGAAKYRINNGYASSQSLWVGTIRIRQSN